MPCCATARSWWRRVKVGADEVQCDMLLLAVGRTAHTGSLALGNAGISVGAHGGVVVDDRLQTSLARVFAAGDCIDGNEQFTHLAGKQGFVAARNAMFWGTSSGTVSALPRCTFTSPEVAAVGLTAEQATAKHGDAVKTYKKAVRPRAGIRSVLTTVAAGSRLLADKAGRQASNFAFAFVWPPRACVAAEHGGPLSC